MTAITASQRRPPNSYGCRTDPVSAGWIFGYRYGLRGSGRNYGYCYPGRNPRAGPDAGGSFDVLAGKVIRIGHMGANANDADMEDVMAALDHTLRALRVPLKKDLLETYKSYANTNYEK